MKTKKRHGLFDWRKRGVQSFVLIEVLVSIVILSVGLTMLMQTFTQALRHMQREQKIATANFLANHLVEDYQNVPPTYDTDEGDFGDSYPNYRWEIIVDAVLADYDIDSDRLDEEQIYQHWLHVKVWCDDPQQGEPFLASEATTCLLGFERFSANTKQKMGLFNRD